LGKAGAPYDQRMSFVAILLALLLEQARPVARSNPIHMLVRLWVRWSATSFDAGSPAHARVAWLVAAALPALAVAGVHMALAWTVGWPLVVVWHVLVLYLTLGFRQFSHHFTAIRDALEALDEDRARLLLAQWRQVEPEAISRTQVVRQVIEHSVLAAHRHVFGVIAWYGVLAALGLGPAGAVFYRLCEFVPRYWLHRTLVVSQPVSAALGDIARRSWYWVDWVPARVTAIGFAVVGSFEEAIEQWRQHDSKSVEDSDGVILSATAGAINLRLGPGYSPEDSPASRDGTPGAAQNPEVGHLRSVVGLVWRTVLMWMVLLALLTLARFLG
jgi:adenosylcobinamide-phosphate synthase